METFLALLTYFAYFFIILLYTVKLIKYLRMPVHLRWELYPVIDEGEFEEEKNWIEKPRKKRYLKGFLFLLKDYFTLFDYAKNNFPYWLGIYPWHMGFILIIIFHILCFFGGLSIVKGIGVSYDSEAFIGRFLYLAILLTGVISFLAGIFGSVVVALNRILNRNLRDYASIQNFFTYFFTFVVFFTGFYSWFFTDPHFFEYREFWVGLLTGRFRDVSFWTKIHIIAFDFFLIYLPFTRSLHYITRFFAFFLIRWDDEPNIRGSKLEKRLTEVLKRRISWSAPHVQKGSSWSDVARFIP